MNDLNPMEFARFKMTGQKYQELRQWMIEY